MQTIIKNHIDHHLRTMEMVCNRMANDIERCGRLLTSALKQGGKVLLMGNGGSAADAQHFSAELIGRFMLERRPLPAIALSTNTSILTAVGNDYGFEEIFVRQVEALAAPGDVVIGISTSGCSGNVYRALTAAKVIGCKTVGLLGRDGGTIADIVDLNLCVPVNETPHIQEAHITIIHILCDLIEKSLFVKKDS
jgi:D-sedoheptulose 7-phosphate isomerase